MRSADPSQPNGPENISAFINSSALRNESQQYYNLASANASYVPSMMLQTPANANYPFLAQTVHPLFGGAHPQQILQAAHFPPSHDEGTAHYSAEAIAHGKPGPGSQPNAGVPVREPDTMLSWRTLHVEVKEKKKGFRDLFTKSGRKVVLDQVSGFVPSGECLAIMGGSGSGKSTLLNIISGRHQKSKGYFVDGQVLLNGQPLNYRQLRRSIGFVMQADILLEHITVGEYFDFAVRLKNDQLDAVQREQLTTLIMDKFKLTHTRNTRVGGKMYKGISGGEKKRLNIGLEMVSNPKIMFLDEPTSGLDSFTSFVIVNIMRLFARMRNLIVIYTIHQPSYETFKLFDNLMLLDKGKVLYFGIAEKGIDYYARLGFPVGPRKNPADHFVEVTMRADAPTLALFNQTYLAEIVPQIEQQAALTPLVPVDGQKKKARFSTEFRVLYKRALLNFVRNPATFAIRIAQSVFIGIIYCLLFARLGDLNDPDTAQRELAQRTYVGASIFIVINQFVSYMITYVIYFPAERLIFSKEYGAGFYGVVSYYFSKLLVEIPIISIIPIAFVAIVYFIVGFVPDAGRFFLTAVALVMLSIWGSVIGLLIGCVVTNAELAMEIAPVIFLPFIVLSGTVQNSNLVPVGLAWVQYISPPKYIYEWMLTAQFNNIVAGFRDTFDFNLNYGWIVLIFGGYLLIAILFSVMGLKFLTQAVKN